MSIKALSLGERNLTRFSCIIKKAATRVLFFVFQQSSSDRGVNEKLVDYYKNKNNDKFEKGLFQDQRKKLDSDHQGVTFDITLLYKCLRDGSHGLASVNDEKWKKEDDTSLEYLLTAVKNKRNTIAHEQPNFTTEELIREAEELEEMLIKILNLCCIQFNLSKSLVDKEIDDVKLIVKDYLSLTFEAKTFEEYKKELFFEAQEELVNDEGMKDVIEQYEKRSEDKVSTANHLYDIRLPLEDIYIDMMLKQLAARSGQDSPTTYEEVLQDENQKETKAIIVVIGEAGVGKTTFTKRVLCDWKAKDSRMKYLASYDHLLKAECRNVTLKSFDDLLYNLMPKVSKEFKEGDLKRVILHQKVLVILDGLDELNSSSALLFEDILNLKKDHDITVMITSRPEKQNHIMAKLKSYHIEMKHIELLGVPSDKRDHLVVKYHCEIEKKCKVTKDISSLLEYLHRTQYRLENIWRLPYNLSLIIILWIFNHINVNDISTGPELYREMLKLYKTKLEERLRSHESTRHLNDSERNKKIKSFLYVLAEESLIGLKNDKLSLPQEAYHRLEKVCSHIKIPIEEMISAFLKRVPGIDITYNYPHKGVQDYLAAHYIWLEITGKDENYDIQNILDGVSNVLDDNHVPPPVRNVILSQIKTTIKESSTRKKASSSGFAAHFIPSRRVSSMIDNILKEINGTDAYDLSKFQNVLISLIGMFYLEKDTVKNDVKLEAAKLLQGSGISDRNGWINVLNTVKCDGYIASYISQQPAILDGHIKITDSSVSAYISLMKALKRSAKDTSRVKIDIEVQEEMKEFREILQLISSHKFQVNSILINDKNLEDYTEMLKLLPKDLVDARRVGIELCVCKDLFSLRDLMTMIRNKEFYLRKMQLKDMEINDSNAIECITLFKSLPHLLDNANETNIHLKISDNFKAAAEVFHWISCLQFKMKYILINEKNYTQYISLLSPQTISFKECRIVEVDVHIDDDLFNTLEVIDIIDAYEFTLREVKLQDFEVNDLNLSECLTALKSLPSILQHANSTRVNLKIRGDIGQLGNSNDLLELIGKHQFQVNTFIINDKNFKKYLYMLKHLRTPFKCSHQVEVEVSIDEDFDTIKDLMIQIVKHNFCLKSFEVKDFQLNDDNIGLGISILQCLSDDPQRIINPIIDIAVKRNLVGAEELLELLAKHQIKVKRILITNRNLRNYAFLLNDLRIPLRDSHQVKIDIQVSVDLLDIKTLLVEINDKGFQLQTLSISKMNESPSKSIKTLPEVKESSVINEDNINKYIEVLKLLPTLDTDINAETISLWINKESSDIDELLNEISRNRFPVNIHLHFDFKNPLRSPTVLKQTLDKVFQRCVVEEYKGHIFSDVDYRKTKRIWACISNTESYIDLRNLLEIKDKDLLSLSICISLEVERDELKPIPGDLDCPPSLYLPDISSIQDVQIAADICRRLNPTHGLKKFAFIFFPRLNLNGNIELPELIRCLKDNNVEVNTLVLPSDCRPQESSVEQDLQTLVKTFNWSLLWGGPNVPTDHHACMGSW